jgi:phage protein D/phage baseplate assembly protein gpV
MPSPTSVPRLKVNGADLAPALVNDIVDVRVYSSVHEASSAVLRVSDPNFKVIDGSSFNIGDPLEVSFQVASASVAVFKGEIVAIGAEQRESGRHEVVVEAMDKSHRLSAEVKAATFLEQTWSDIVKKIAGKYGLTAKVDATTEKHEYVLQTVSDRTFLTRIADAIGFEWFVDGTDLIFRKRPAASSPVATLSWLDSLLRFEVRASAADVVNQVTVRGWDRTNSQEINGVVAAASGAEALGSDSSLASTTFSKGKSIGKNFEVVPGAITTSGEAKTAATGIMNDTQAALLRVTGEAYGEPKIKAGSWIEVKDCGTKLKGKYYVTECEHLFGGSQPYRTRFKLSRQRDATQTPPTSNGLSGGGFGVAGLVVGVVTNIKDEKTSKQRVKVKFPTLPGLESGWARVVVLGGGPKTGVDMRPEVGDEVLVGFEHGDLRLPYVIGGLTSKPDHEVKPAVKDGKVILRSITSRAGHRIEISDESGDDKNYVMITTAKQDTKARFGQDMVEISTKAKDGLIFTDGKAKITMKDGKVVIDADSVEIKAKQGITVDGQKVEVKAKTGVAADGGAKFEAKGAQVMISGSAMTEVKGSLLKLN